MHVSVALASIGALLPKVVAHGPVYSDINEQPRTSIWNDGGGFNCSSQVSIDCTYPGSDGKIYSCVAEENNGPFLQILTKNCTDFGTDGIISATVTMSMCNMNVPNANANYEDTFYPSTQFTSFKIATEKYYNNFEDANYVLPSGNNSNNRQLGIKPGTCQTMTQIHEMNACTTPNVPFSVQMQGRIGDDSRNRFCRAYVHRKNKIKLFPDEILENPTMFAVPVPAPALVAATRFDCENEVSMSCEFEHKETTYSCIHESPENVNPILVSEEGECANNEFKAVIKMEICNTSNGVIEPKIEKKTSKVLKSQFIFDGSDEGPNNLFDTNWEVNGCKSITVEKTIDPCRKFVPMSIRYYGQNSSGETCNTYLYRKIQMEKIVTPPEATPTPDDPNLDTTPDTPNQTPDTPNQTPDTPNQTPETPDPDVDDCDPTDAIITEVAVPDEESTDADHRYVELYFKNCAGRTIKNDVKVERRDATDGATSHTPLTNFLVPSDGFVVICSKKNQFDVETCDIESDVGSNGGQDYVAILKSDGPEIIIDSYGSTTSQQPNIQDGRAVRKKRGPEYSNIFVMNEWTFYPGENGGKVNPEGIDPRVWVISIIITEIGDSYVLNDGLSDQLHPRFIEMFVPNDYRSVINDDLKLVLYHGDDVEPSFENSVSLKEKDVPDNGYIVVCNDAAASTLNAYGCDFVNSPLFDGRRDAFGCDRAAIVHGNAAKFRIVDMYGLIGGTCGNNMHDFTDGRGIRLANSTIPEPTWNYYNWEVIKGVGPGTPGQPDPDVAVCDPADAIITEVAVPYEESTDADHRYVELYFKDCAGRRIKNDVKVERRVDATDDVSHTLTNFLVPSDGFVVICSKDNQFYVETCDIVSDVGSNGGQDRVAILESDVNGGIIDSYGSTTFPQPNIQDGRAVRKKRGPDAQYSDIFVMDEWTFYPGENGGKVNPEGLDPRVWVISIIITEIGDSYVLNDGLSDQPHPRFIEMFVPNDYRSVINDDLKLVLYHGDDVEPSFENSVSLKEKDVPDNGYIVVCNDAAASTLNAYGCDFVNSPLFDGRRDAFGCDRAAIVHGNAAKFRIVDMYGLIGGTCGNNMHDFTDGRGIRLANSTIPEPTWNYYNWEVIKGVGPGTPGQPDPDVAVCDPTDAIITEVAVPYEESTDADHRYVELYFKDCAGRRIKNDVKVERRDATDDAKSHTLTNFPVPSDGFVVICSKDNQFDDGTCDIVSDVGSNGGQDYVAILESDGLVNDGTGIIDSYGSIPSQQPNIQDGRAVRKKRGPEYSNIFVMDEWTFYPGENGGNVDPEGLDPRVWVIGPDTELLDPGSPPSPVPAKGSKGGKDAKANPSPSLRRLRRRGNARQ